jgi:predicted enzyme related to lactoylglutathione lyase
MSNAGSEEKLSVISLSIIKIFVSDLDRAVQFYAGVTGFRAGPIIHSKSGARELAMLPPGGGNGFMLMEYTKAPDVPGSNVCLVFNTQDAGSFADSVLQNGGTIIFGPEHIETPNYDLNIVIGLDFEGNKVEAVQKN